MTGSRLIPEIGAKLSRLLLLFLPAMASGSDAPLFDPATGYRVAQYRAVVPAPPAGVQQVGAKAVRDLAQAGAILLDVFPLKHYEIDENGAWITPDSHASLPGAVWLPIVGWGQLTPAQETYLRQSLTQVTAGDKTRALVVFCQLDCWLSWNASRRIAEYGHNQVFWFSGGVDEWNSEGFPLKSVVPYPMPPDPPRPSTP
ncbi:rhodanese-like domain-containing protein [Gemmobacter fulvus]|uniref:rhodanese-like domain-containing protein n=1 Tax=Gemmobacter fulvus TaxID=2840474 RepID=UPI002796B03B|nr:rhodanese-like domain-containing protein [Gemmobacter fulvus]MDQ1850399.1 rhodanese-like domain-containing protein [Gemmobacter fulvus]